MVVGWSWLLADGADSFGVATLAHIDFNTLAGLAFTGGDVDEAWEVVTLI
jgi:hypothetical protein